MLTSCAGQTAGERLADMPQWMGGIPPGVPPRRGTPEYDAWMAARAQEAAKPKTVATQIAPSPSTILLAGCGGEEPHGRHVRKGLLRSAAG